MRIHRDLFFSEYLPGICDLCGGIHVRRRSHVPESVDLSRIRDVRWFDHVWDVSNLCQRIYLSGVHYVRRIGDMQQCTDLCRAVDMSGIRDM